MSKSIALKIENSTGLSNNLNIIESQTPRDKASVVLENSTKETTMPNVTNVENNNHISAQSAIQQLESAKNLPSVFNVMKLCFEAGLISKKDKQFYVNVEDEDSTSRMIINTFKSTLSRIRNEKNAKSKTSEKYRPSKRLTNPLRIQIDGQTFDYPEDALVYANKLENVDVETFRQRYFGLLSQRIEGINKSIDEALLEIKKTERISTRGNNIGLIDILRPFENNKIIRFSGGIYESNPAVEKAEELAKSATEKRNSIESKLKKDKEDFEKRQARRNTYKEILKSENGFEQVIKNEGGREVARFAYQIEVKQIPGTNFRQIIIKKMVLKFGSVKFKEGDVLAYGDRRTPIYLDEAADEIKKKQEGNAKFGDIMTKELGSNEEKAK